MRTENIERNMTMVILEATPKRLFSGTFILIILIGSISLFSYSIKNVESTGEWWNTSWHFRKSITIDHTKVDSTLNNFPVLISLTDSNLAAKAQADGDDIVFTDASKKKLNHEIESFNAVSGQLVACVQADLSSTADTILYLYYGNPTATNQQNGPGTWDSYFVMVQHLEETSNPVTDSTSYHNDGIYSGSGQDVAGKIDGADYFRGDYTLKDHIAVPHSTSLNLGTGDFTIAVWLYFTNCIDTDVIRKGDTQTASCNYKLEVINSNGASSTVNANLVDQNNARNVAIQTSGISDNNWHFVVFLRKSQTIYLYVDTVLKASNSNAPQDLTNTANMGIGSKDNYDDDFYHGTIDEVEVSTTARSVAWIKASYNQANGNLATYGSEEARPTIKSCNSIGTDKDTFTVGQPVYVYGSGYPQANTYNLYIVNDINDWSSITNIPADVRGAPTTVQTDSSGQIIPKPPNPPAVWTPTSVGKYDIIVDVNNNGEYNAGIDAVDGLDIGTTGLFVIPEYALGTIIAVAVCFIGAVVYKRFRYNRLKAM
jgi:hypothetical protein